MKLSIRIHEEKTMQRNPNQKRQFSAEFKLLLAPITSKSSTVHLIAQMMLPNHMPIEKNSLPDVFISSNVIFVRIPFGPGISA